MIAHISLQHSATCSPHFSQSTIHCSSVDLECVDPVYKGDSMYQYYYAQNNTLIGFEFGLAEQ